MLTRKRYVRTLVKKLIDLFRDPAEKPAQVQKATQRDNLNKGFSNGYSPAKLRSVRNSSTYTVHNYWQGMDFTPVDHEIEEVFGKLGWLSNSKIS